MQSLPQSRFELNKFIRLFGAQCARHRMRYSSARAEARAATLTAPKLLCHAICIPNYSTIPAESMANKSIELNCDFYACMISLINTLCARHSENIERPRERERESETTEEDMQTEQGRCIESNNNNRAKLFYCHQFKFIVCSLLSSCSFCLLLSPPFISLSLSNTSLYNILWPAMLCALCKIECMQIIY